MIAPVPVHCFSITFTGNFATFEGWPYRRSKCTQGTLNFNCIQLLPNNFCKQRYITLNATIPEKKNRSYQKT